MKLYHEAVYMSKELKNEAYRFIYHCHSLRYSNHLESLVRTKSKKNFDMLEVNLKTIKSPFIHIFEIETNDGKVTKVALRKHYDANRDISIVLRQYNDTEYIVVTAWLNRKDDIHLTLDISKYEKA